MRCINLNQIIVEATSNKYPIVFAEDFSGLSALAQRTNLAGRKLCILADSHVSKLYLEQVKEAMQEAFQEIYCYEFEAGESHKNLDTIQEFYRFFIENHFDRQTVLAALGGGVCGDMVGFAAATYLRGVSFIQIPTTLLAQVDSSVGGKTGVDFQGSKNMIGAFYQPCFVYININTLQSLPKREFVSGLAEVIKYGYIQSCSFYKIILKNKEAIRNRETRVLTELVKQCCEFKARVVSRDEKETGIREILNFGHSIGHAIETEMNFELYHGECVGIGMLAAFSICVKKGMVTQEDFEEGRQLLEYFEIPTKVKGISAEQIYQQMFLDKKTTKNKIKMILLSKIGEAYSTDQLSKEEIMEAIASIL